MTLLYSQAKLSLDEQQSESIQSFLATHIAKALCSLGSMQLSQHRIESEIKLVAKVCLFSDFEFFTYAAPTIKFFKLLSRRSLCVYDNTKDANNVNL